MADIQLFPSCVALLADMVASRETDRPASHQATLTAIERVNAKVPQLDVLRVTVGDELQGVYATLGDALAASFALRHELVGRVDLRFGFGGGEVRVLDAERGIQDGSAWLLAREAVESVERRAGEAGLGGLRTAIRDARDVASPVAEPLSQLVDAHLARLKEGPRATLTALLEGLDNQDAARRLGISPSANSQRVTNNDLRPLAAAIRALEALP